MDVDPTIYVAHGDRRSSYPNGGPDGSHDESEPMAVPRSWTDIPDESRLESMSCCR